MNACEHTRIEACDEHDDDMHCVGWICVDCGHQGLGECHHRSWCRSDFCGDERVSVGIVSLGVIRG